MEKMDKKPEGIPARLRGLSLLRLFLQWVLLVWNLRYMRSILEGRSYESLSALKEKE